eukprot:4803305-Pyramimonas_sp.AAC.1
MATGSTWPRSRLCEAGIFGESDSYCVRCNLNQPETPFHRSWQCSANGNLAACRETADLEQEAADGYQQFPCFWLRGLIPASWTDVDPPLSEAH